MEKINEKTHPLCVIGTWAWGSGINGSKMIFGKSYSEEQLAKTFEAAYSKGFTMWDTAEVYGMGNSEKILGKLTSDKDDVVISTKHLPSKKYKQGEVTKALNASLERLSREYVDLYWLHQPYNLKENLSEAAQCVKSGKTKSIGLSNCNLQQLKTAVEILYNYGLKLHGVQNHFSLLSFERQKDVLEFCRKNDIVFYGYMILEQGALSGHYNPSHLFPKLSSRGMSFSKNKFIKIAPLIDYIRLLADKYRVDTSQIPIVWAIQKNVVPIVGLTKSRHALNLADGTKIKLSDSEINTLEALAVNSGVICKGSWE